MRLLYVVTEDWYFLSHRLPMARAARDAGFEVHVATRVVDGAAAIGAEGFVLHPVPFVRGRISPLGTIATIRALRRGPPRGRAGHRPSRRIAGHGARIACRAGACRSAASTRSPGLGYTFTSGNAKALLLRPIIGALLRLLLNRPRQIVLVQNPDDRDGMLSLGIAAERIVLIPGSGVDVEALQPMPEPPGSANRRLCRHGCSPTRAFTR